MGDRSERFLGGIEQAHDIGLARHVGWQGDRLATLGGDVGRDLLRLGIARAVVDRHPVAALSGKPGRRGADAAGAAGYQQGHPFTAPPVRPCTRYRLTTKEKASTGSMIMVPPAAMRPHSQPS